MSDITLNFIDQPLEINFEQGLQGAQGDAGAQGPQGETGPQGPPGVGVPAGGVAGEVLQKIDGTDYNAAWGAVALDSIAHIPNHKLLGRHSTGDGNVQTIGLDGGLEFNGSNIRREAFTGGDVTASAGSNVLRIVDALKNAWDGAVAWVGANGANLLAHLSSTSNPHGVTNAQVLYPVGRPAVVWMCDHLGANMPAEIAVSIVGSGSNTVSYTPATGPYTGHRLIYAGTAANASAGLYLAAVDTRNGDGWHYATIRRVFFFAPTTATYNARIGFGRGIIDPLGFCAWFQFTCAPAGITIQAISMSSSITETTTIATSISYSVSNTFEVEIYYGGVIFKINGVQVALHTISPTGTSGTVVAPLIVIYRAVISTEANYIAEDYEAIKYFHA